MVACPCDRGSFLVLCLILYHLCLSTTCVVSTQGVSLSLIIQAFLLTAASASIITPDLGSSSSKHRHARPWERSTPWFTPILIPKALKLNALQTTLEPRCSHIYTEAWPVGGFRVQDASAWETSWHWGILGLQKMHGFLLAFFPMCGPGDCPGRGKALSRT